MVSRIGPVVCVSAILSLSACADDRSEAGEAGGQARQSSAPRLVRQTAWQAPSPGLLGSSISIAVTDAGTIGMLEPDGIDDPVLVLVDAKTGSARRMIRRGEGPNEMSGAGVLSARGDTFKVLDLGRQEAVTLSGQGEILDRTRLALMADLVLDVRSDSVDLIAFSGAAQEGIRRRAIGGGIERKLLLPSDSFFQSLIASYASKSGMLRRHFGFAATSQGYVVADGYAFSLAGYTNGGARIWTASFPRAPRVRDEAEVARLRADLVAEGVPKAEVDQIVERLRSEVLPHFEGQGVWLDRQGLVWLVREAGDSTRVEQFFEGNVLGGATLPCSRPGRRIGFSENWLVLLCEPASAAESEQGVDLQVYEVHRNH